MWCCVPRLFWQKSVTVDETSVIHSLPFSQRPDSYHFTGKPNVRCGKNQNIHIAFQWKLTFHKLNAVMVLPQSICVPMHCDCIRFRLGNLNCAQNHFHVSFTLSSLLCISFVFDNNIFISMSMHRNCLSRFSRNVQSIVMLLPRPNR